MKNLRCAATRHWIRKTAFSALSCFFLLLTLRTMAAPAAFFSLPVLLLNGIVLMVDFPAGVLLTIAEIPVFPESHGAVNIYRSSFAELPVWCLFAFWCARQALAPRQKESPSAVHICIYALLLTAIASLIAALARTPDRTMFEWVTVLANFGGVLGLSEYHGLYPLRACLTLFEGLLLFLIMVSEVRSADLKRVFPLLAAGLAVVTLYGFVDYFAVDRSAYFHGVNRAQSFYPNPNFLAAYLIALIPLIYIHIEKGAFRALGACLGAAALLLLALTFSRGAWFAGLFSLALCVLFDRTRCLTTKCRPWHFVVCSNLRVGTPSAPRSASHRALTVPDRAVLGAARSVSTVRGHAPSSGYSGRAKVIGGVLAVVLILQCAGTVVISFDPAVQRYVNEHPELRRLLSPVNLNEPLSDSLSGRAGLWAVSARAFRVNWLSGLGIGRFFRDFDQYYTPHSHAPDWALHQNAHNFFLQVGVELGLIGLVPLLIFFAVLYFQALRSVLVETPRSSSLRSECCEGSTSPRFESGLLVGFMAGLSALLSHSMVEHIFLYPRQMLYLWFFAGAVAVLSRERVAPHRTEGCVPTALFNSRRLLTWGSASLLLAAALKVACPSAAGGSGLHDRVKSRAEQIWREEGKPDHREREHWLQAEEEVFFGISD